MSQEREILNNKDVISVFKQFKHDKGRFASGDTLKVLQLLTEYEGYIQEQTNANNSEIFLKGIECQVLRQNSKHQGWRKGKIKFVIQFESESTEVNKSTTTLDDIRKQIDPIK